MIPADSPCGPYELAYALVRDVLATHHGQTVRVATYQLDDGHRLERWANPESTTWTAIAVTPDGTTACMLLMGEGDPR